MSMAPLNKRLLSAALMGSLSLAGCTVPRQGALTSEIRKGSAQSHIVLIPVDQALVMQSRRQALSSLPDHIKAAGVARSDTLSVGDQLHVTIVEGMSDVVPSAIGGRLELAQVDVANDGSITIPFAGRFPVAGRPMEEVRQSVQARLGRSLFKPQVQMRRIASPNQSVSIMGDVTKGGAFPLNADVMRLADLVGAAGVKVEKTDQVRVELRRDGQVYPIALRALLNDPSNNVALRGGDVVSVNRSPEYVTVMGAISTPGRVEIANDRFSVLDVLAEARGLSEKSADPSGVYLFLRDADLPTTMVPDAQGQPTPRPVRVVSIDVRDPAQILLARQLHVVDGDLIYVSTAGFAQTIKVLDIISRTLNPIMRVPL
jgi:polysaccharide export outer membrane protein